MALSQITTECRRYGCMKNLLACFANCRYNTRCEDLRNEIQDKTEQAAGDINQYLAEKSAPPIRIQMLTRGLKFVPLSKLEKPKRERKPESAISNKSHAMQMQTEKKKRSRKRTMSGKAKPVQSIDTTASATSAQGTEQNESRPKKGRASSQSRSNSAGRSKKNGKGKLYIILENETATIVDEQGMIRRMLAGPSKRARFFEAKEVEAQLQIVYKK